MNSKVENRYNNGSPNMFGAYRKINGSTYYNRKLGGSPTERTRRKTEQSESEPILIPTSRQNSPRGGSPRGGSPSGGSYYAGAKFSEPPSPASLPNPPSHWMPTSSSGIIIGDCSHEYYQHENGDQYLEISNQLKMLLNIRA